MGLSQIALPGSGIAVSLGPPTASARQGTQTVGELAGQGLQFPWTWLAKLEDLPLPSAMITSLTAGGVVYAIQLAAMLGRNIPLSARVRQELQVCCQRLGIEPGQAVPDWWDENIDALEAAFGEQVRYKVIEHVSWQLPLSQVQEPSWGVALAAKPMAAAMPMPWTLATMGLAVPCVPRPVAVLGRVAVEDFRVSFAVSGPSSLELHLSASMDSGAGDRVWVWPSVEIEPVCYAITRSQGAVWTVEGVVAASNVFALALEREGTCLGSSFRAPMELAEVVLSSEGWECTASWLRWFGAPIFDGPLQRTVARRVKAEPEASLAAWLTPVAPNGAVYADSSSSGALLQEFFGSWWASEDDADAMIRAAKLQGSDPDAWVRLAMAHPVLLGQLLVAGWRRRPARERKALLVAICDRLAEWIVPGGRGGEAHWELAEQTALRQAAQEWGIGEWMFTSQAQAGALSDWMNGRPVPPEMRHRWTSAWAGQYCCQWTAIHLVRELLIGYGAGERTLSATA